MPAIITVHKNEMARMATTNPTAGTHTQHVYPNLNSMT
jgi:hypothetical protein